MTGQFRVDGDPSPYGLKVHKVGVEGKPVCGRWVDTWTDPKGAVHNMIFAINVREKVDCHNCLRL